MNRGYNRNMIMCALQAMNYVSIHNPAVCDEIVEAQSPLDILIEKEEAKIRHEKYRSLSNEAKEVITMIFHAPPEILDLITSSKILKFSKNKIERFLQKKWGNKEFPRKIISELEEYATVINENAGVDVFPKRKICRGSFTILYENGTKQRVFQQDDYEIMKKLKKELCL